MQRSSPGSHRNNLGQIDCGCKDLYNSPITKKNVGLFVAYYVDLVQGFYTVTLFQFSFQATILKEWVY